jgi:Fe-S-cluster containining protein
MQKRKKKFYQHGIRFKCTGCGACCGNRNEYGFVYVILPERRRLARHLRIPTRTFTRQFCNKTDGFYYIRDRHNRCIFQEDARCSVYRARPEQCRTWPFWRENMNPKVWQTEVLRDCPGAGKGKLHSPEHIEKLLNRKC